jgi:hypothetical protein
MTRRGLLAGAAALALARPAAAAAAQSHAEQTADALRDLIALERKAAVAYDVVGQAVLARHEAEHSGALLPHLESVGHRALPFPRAVQHLDGRAYELAVAPAARRRRAAIALEEDLIAAYREALSRLYDPATKRTAATIMASHAQHLVALRGAGPLEPVE